jgi:CRP-like cAMP-binding protein
MSPGRKLMDSRKQKLTTFNSAYAAELVEKIGTKVNFKAFPRGKRIFLSATQPNKIYVIRSGIIAIHRQPDDILMGYLEAPTIRGMANAYHSNLRFQSEYIIKVVESVELAVIEREAFYTLLHELQLWDVYAKILEMNISILGDHIFKHLSPTVYDVVRIRLPELMSEPDSVRNSVTVEEYIRSKTRLSRSRIMQILSELRVAGYIKTEKGYLVWVKELPKAF